MAQYVFFTVKDNAKDWVKYLNTVAEKTQLDIDEKLPNLRRNTKRTVTNELFKGHGMETGIYKKSFTINNYALSKWEIGFQVFAKKPHYRLTHLLEDGHESKVFRWGKGKLTKWGNKGMVNIGRRGRNVKGASQHIAKGQEYAEKKVQRLYMEAINKSLGERMKKL